MVDLVLRPLILKSPCADPIMKASRRGTTTTRAGWPLPESLTHLPGAAGMDFLTERAQQGLGVARATESEVGIGWNQAFGSFPRGGWSSFSFRSYRSAWIPGGSSRAAKGGTTETRIVAVHAPDIRPTVPDGFSIASGIVRRNVVNALADV